MSIHLETLSYKPHLCTQLNQLTKYLYKKIKEKHKLQLQSSIIKERKMRYYIFLLLSTLLFSNTPPTPVPHVDIKKFSGLWYEIARTHNDYQKNCVAATVEYNFQTNNTYKIYNRCFKYVIGGDLIEYNGTGKPTNGNSMSKIDMTYYYFFTSEYRVIYLEKDYSAAVVADKDMEQVWIMSRKPTLSKRKFDKILTKLENNMDIQRLILTPQDEKGRYK